MILRTGPTVGYSLWLKKILDTHTTRAWDSPPSPAREDADERLNEIWED